MKNKKKSTRSPKRTLNMVLAQGAVAPSYKTAGAAGADLYAYLPGGEQIIRPGEIGRIASGVKVSIGDSALAIMLIPRSSLGDKRVKLANTIGLIDSDYLGDIIMLLENTGKEDFVVSNGDRLAQIVFFNVEQVKFKKVESFEQKTGRGEGAFGSTGA